MKHSVTCISIAMLLLLATFSTAQNPATIVQEKCIGGSNIDELRRMRTLSDGDLAAIGSSASTNGNVPGNSGGLDAWMFIYDILFNPNGSDVFGGPADEKGVDLVELPTADIVVLANTMGTQYGCSAGANIALIKRDPSGAITDHTCMSGSLFDEGARVLQDPVSGNLIVLGNIRSTDGFYAPWSHHGQVDMGIFEFNSQFDLQRGALVGSSGVDLVKDAILDGDHLWIFGETSGVDGDMAGTTAFGSDDLVALKWSLPAWDLTLKYRYGGSNTEHVERVAQRPGGGFAWFGNTWSTTFFGCSNPTSNAFAMGTSANGTVDWTQCLQGSGTESISSAIYSATHGVHFIAGHSSSTDEDFIGGDLSWQAFVAAMDDWNGDLSWMRLFGGSGSDQNRDILQLANGNLLTLNWTSSNDGDVQSSNHGNTDAWLVEFSHTTAVAEYHRGLSTLNISPVPTNDRVTVQLPPGTQRIELYDVHGRCVSTEVLGASSSIHVIDLSGQPSGIYTIRTSAATPNGTGRCVKM